MTNVTILMIGDHKRSSGRPQFSRMVGLSSVWLAIFIWMKFPIFRSCLDDLFLSLENYFAYFLLSINS